MDCRMRFSVPKKAELLRRLFRLGVMTKKWRSQKAYKRSAAIDDRADLILSSSTLAGSSFGS